MTGVVPVPTENRRAVGYARISTDEQARGGVSLDAQEAGIRAYADRRGLDLVAVVRDEGVSGIVPLADRPGVAKVLTLIEAHDARHVVALVPDCLGRDLVDANRWIRHRTSAGVAVHFTDSGGHRDNVSATGWAMFALHARASELERADLVTVKNGFSWTAVIFGAIWAWRSRGMVGVGFGLVGLNLGLYTLIVLLMMRFGEGGGGTIGLMLGVAVLGWVGSSGNKWRRDALTRQGYELLGNVVQRTSKAEALRFFMESPKTAT